MQGPVQRLLPLAHGTVSHGSHSAGSVRITGIAFGCTSRTSAFGGQVRKAYAHGHLPLLHLPHAASSSSRVWGTPPAADPRRGLTRPAHSSRRISRNGSAKLVRGTRQRCAGASQARQCGEVVLRMSAGSGTVCAGGEQANSFATGPDRQDFRRIFGPPHNAHFWPRCAAATRARPGLRACQQPWPGGGRAVLFAVLRALATTRPGTARHSLSALFVVPYALAIGARWALTVPLVWVLLGTSADARCP